jgi:site-specific DNA-methyltransferase (adenine-specific)
LNRGDDFANVQLMQGDCLQLMKDIPDKSIDMILCDLPYVTTSCKWDTVIPFELLWKQYNRIIKPTSAIVLFCSQPFTSMLIASNIKQFREEIIWLKNKPASGMMSDYRHMKIHEEIEVFSQSAKYTYNPQRWLVEEKEFLTQRKTFKENEYIGNQIYAATHRTRKPDTGERNPISIISAKTPFNTAKTKVYRSDIEIRVHPTQKPISV